MRSTRPLTHRLNVCLGIFGFSYCMKTVLTQSNWGMQIIAQMQVNVFFLFSYDKHYHMLHIIVQKHYQNQYVTNGWCIYRFITYGDNVTDDVVIEMTNFDK